MKPIIILSFFLLCALVACVQGVSQPIIMDTRAEGCIEGVCNSHCAWDGVKIFPSESLNQPGKCRLLRCSSDFSIYISPCPFDSKFQFNVLDLFADDSHFCSDRSVRVREQRPHEALPRVLWNEAEEKIALRIWIESSTRLLQFEKQKNYQHKVEEVQRLFNRNVLLTFC